MPITVKAIKPRKINNASFAQMANEFGTMTEAYILERFRRTVKTWKHKPEFTHGYTVTPIQVKVEVYTEHDIYTFVHEGTKPHIIRPKRAKFLRFQSGFEPKTKPNVINSFEGRKFGDWINAQVVHHPGTTGRKFAPKIGEMWGNWFSGRKRKMLQKATKDSGHEI